jgi:CHAT domain-containing protein
MRNFSEAATEAQQALEIAAKTHASPLEADARYVLGEIARESGQVEESLKHFAAAREVIKNLGSPEVSWRVDFGRGQSLERLNRNEEALAAYLAAAATIEQVRNELREERFRAGYLEDKYQVYVALVELLLKLGRLDEAFSFSEKLRARSYLDLIGRGSQPIRNEAQRLREKALRNRIQKLQEDLDQEFAKPAPQQRRAMVELFSNELTRAEREYQNLIDDLRSADPNFARINSVSVPTGNEVQQKLDSDTALIEYVMSERSLSIFVLRTNGLKAITVPVSADDLRTRVQLLRSLMERNQTDEWKLPAGRLYRSLISPVEEAGWLAGLSRIYIVPHSILHYVPFGVLRNATGGREQLLVQKYSVAYLPAAAALVHTNKTQTSRPSILAMAPSTPGLHYTQQESIGISPFFPAKHTVLLGDKATESSFKSLAGTYDVIHLATHGYFNKINPLLSGVMLEADSNEDGRLEVHEILELHLHAQLVTLSACNTALGSGYFAEVPAGDDIVGLTRAFLFAGSPSVLATLWEVNDRSSVQLMRGFYRELGNGDKAFALAKSQRNLLVPGSRYRHPYYWAPFVLVGTMN